MIRSVYFEMCMVSEMVWYTSFFAGNILNWIDGLPVRVYRIVIREKVKIT